VLLLVILFIFAVIFKEQASDIRTLSEELFPTVLKSVWNLLLLGLLDDPAGTIQSIYEHSKPLAMLFVCFVFITSYTVLNLLAGILFDVVIKVKDQEEEDDALEELKRDLDDIIEVFDKDGDEKIHREELDLLLASAEMTRILKHAHIDVAQVASLCNATMETREEGLGAFVNFEELIKIVKKLRRANPNDLIVDLRDYVKHRFDLVLDKIGSTSGDAATPGRQPLSPGKKKQPSFEPAGRQKNLPELPKYVQAALMSLEKYAASEAGANETPEFHLGVATLQEWGQERLQIQDREA